MTTEAGWVGQGRLQKAEESSSWERTRTHTEVEPQQASHRSVSFSSSYTVPGTGKTIYCLSDT